MSAIQNGAAKCSDEQNRLDRCWMNWFRKRADESQMKATKYIIIIAHSTRRKRIYPNRLNEIQCVGKWNFAILNSHINTFTPQSPLANGTNHMIEFINSVSLCLAHPNFHAHHMQSVFAYAMHEHCVRCVCVCVVCVRMSDELN